MVHKFGGSSLASAEHFRRVAAILRDNAGPRQAIVVSAMAKVTDALVELTELATRRDEVYLARLEALLARHLETVEALLPEPARESLRARLRADANDLRELLRGVFLSRSCSERMVELISGHGELWSAQLLAAHLEAENLPAVFLDARSVLTVEPGESTVAVDWARSQEQVDRWRETLRTERVVITGFVASTPDGIPTTLKRNGSDFSASIFGRLLGARAIVIWTDVDGVLSADPRLVPDAVVLDEVSYQEATELAYFGAKVVHPSTMAPAIEAQIPIWIRNTFNPAAAGTEDPRASFLAHADQGLRHGRWDGVDQRRGHRDDWRARRGPSPLRRAARGGGLGGHDLAG